MNSAYYAYDLGDVSREDAPWLLGAWLFAMLFGVFFCYLVSRKSDD
jgi:hypothetical protein